MNEIPTWWLVLSGLFFVANMLLFVVLAFVGLRVVAMLKDLQPKIVNLTTKVEGIAEKVTELTETTKVTVENVGGRAKNVAGSVELIAHSASRQFERFSPLLVGGITLLRLLSAVRQYRGEEKNGRAKLSPDEVKAAAERELKRKQLPPAKKPRK